MIRSEDGPRLRGAGRAEGRAECEQRRASCPWTCGAEALREEAEEQRARGEADTEERSFALGREEPIGRDQPE